jgi:hypothetical protein
MFAYLSGYPACCTDTLLIGCPQTVAEAGAREGGWIRTFSPAAQLRVRMNLDDSEVPLVTSYEFLPTLEHPLGLHDSFVLTGFPPCSLPFSRT